MMHFAEQYFAGFIDKTDAAKIDDKLLLRSSSVKLSPALLHGANGDTCDTTLNSKNGLTAFGLGGNSKHDGLPEDMIHTHGTGQ
jgi:hypothetical protein